MIKDYRDVCTLRQPDRIYIGGEWVRPTGNTSLTLINPATENVVGVFPEASRADIDTAVAAARRAFDDGPWPRMSPQERGAILLKAGELLSKRAPELGLTQTLEVGIAVKTSKGGGAAAGARFTYYGN